MILSKIKALIPEEGAQTAAGKKVVEDDM